MPQALCLQPLAARIAWLGPRREGATLMVTAVYSHPACERHDPGEHHPESPRRLHAVRQALQDARFEGLDRLNAPPATLEQIDRVHAAGYGTRLLDHIPESGRFNLDSDTIVSAGSGEAALRAAGALCAAVDGAITGTHRRAFCAVRPPGHHAEPARAMGFCLFNNVAIGAAHARAAHGVNRVAIVDFDVHHGNGTQAIFAEESNVLLASSHQMPLYPGTGAAEETGLGNIVNMPLSPMSGGATFRAVWREAGLPRLRDFEPELILISAGFDGHRADPLAQLMLHEDDFGWLTGEIVAISEAVCGGRVVSTLEGGYDLVALAHSVTAHVAALMAA